MASKQGSLLTTDLPVDLAKKSYAGTFMRLMPNGPAPIFGITANLKTKTALQVEHGYYTKMMVFPDFTVTAGALAAATVLAVDDSSDLVPGQTFVNTRTLEQIRLVSVDSAVQVTVQRGYGSSPAAAILASDFFPCVGNVNEEGSARPIASAIIPTRTTNLSQTFRNSWQLTDTMRATQVIAGEGNLSESRMDCMAFHAADMEKALIFSERFEGVLNNKPVRKMDGIIASIRNKAPGNITTAGATTNYSQLEAALDPVFNFQSDPKMAMERTLFVGGDALKVINKIGRLSGQYHIVDGQTAFGLQFTEFRISRGRFKMIEHPLLNSNPQWKKMAIAIDFSAIALAYLGDRKTKSEEYGVNGKYVENGLDAVGGSLTTEMTLEMMNPYSCGVIYGLTDGAAG